MSPAFLASQDLQAGACGRPGSSGRFMSLALLFPFEACKKLCSFPHTLCATLRRAI